MTRCDVSVFVPDVWWTHACHNHVFPLAGALSNLAYASLADRPSRGTKVIRSLWCLWGPAFGFCTWSRGLHDDIGLDVLVPNIAFLVGHVDIILSQTSHALVPAPSFRDYYSATDARSVVGTILCIHDGVIMSRLFIFAFSLLSPLPCLAPFLCYFLVKWFLPFFFW